MTVATNKHDYNSQNCVHVLVQIKFSLFKLKLHEFLLAPYEGCYEWRAQRDPCMVTCSRERRQCIRVANRNGREYHLPKINFAVRTCPVASTLPVLYCLHTDV